MQTHPIEMGCIFAKGVGIHAPEWHSQGQSDVRSLLYLEGFITVVGCVEVGVQRWCEISRDRPVFLAWRLQTLGGSLWARQI